MHKILTDARIGRRSGGRERARGRGDQRSAADGGLGERCGKRRGTAGKLADEPATVIGSRVPGGERLVFFGERDEHIGGRLRVEHWFERGLLQTDLALHANGVTPALKPVVVGKNEIAQLRRFVGDRRERHLERHLGKRRGETSRLGHRVRRVGAAHERERHCARVHLLDCTSQVGVRREAIKASVSIGRLDGGTDGTGLPVDVGYHGATVHGVGRRDAADRHDTAAGGRDGLGERFERRRRNTRGIGRGGHRTGAGQRGTDLHFAARLGGDPLIGVEPSE